MAIKRREQLGRIQIDTEQDGGSPANVTLSPLVRTRPASPVAALSPPTVPVRPPEEPTYLTLKNAPTVGWQSRNALNAQLAENYRSQLAAATQGGVANAANTTALQRELIGTRSAAALNAANIAAESQKSKERLASEAALQSQRLASAENLQESELAARSRQAAERSAFEAGESALERKAREEARRESEAASLVTSGVLRTPEAVRNYAALGPTAPINLAPPPGRESKKEFIAPTFRKGLNPEEPDTLQTPPGVFDPATGTIEYIEDADDIDKMIAALRKKNR